MYDDYEHEIIRRQMIQRYNRKFFLGAHIAILIMTLLIVFVVPSLQILIGILSVALIPHILFVAYFEYYRWLEKKIEGELHHNRQQTYMTEKYKRYPTDSIGEARFRLTDDGEIEKVSPSFDLPHTNWNDSRESQGHGKAQTKKERKYHDEYKYRKQEKNRHKDDTDEFDVKKILKKLKDIVD